MSSVYEFHQDQGVRDAIGSKKDKRIGKKIFRKIGKKLLDEAPTKYWGYKGWYY